MLNSFPLELLEHITSYLTAQYTGLLVLCGDKALTHKLCNAGGVRYFRWSRDIKFRATWPHMVSQFSRLRFYSMSVQHYAPYAPLDKLDFASLPRSITDIRISIQVPADAFTTFLIDNPTHFHDLIHINLLNSHTSFDPILTTSSSIANLEYLNSYFRTLSVGLLPKNLTYLYVSNSCPMDTTHGTQFPEGLTYLNYTNTAGPIKPYDLPRGLRTYSSFGRGLYSNEEMAEFPRTITSLLTRIDDPNETGVTGLPPNLTLLSSLSKVRTTFTHLLPRSLTQVSIYGDMKNEHLKHLPPALTELDADDAFHLKHDQFPLLPPSLLTLKTSHAPKPKVTRLIASFPPCLHTLHISAVGSILAPKLPKTLTELLIFAGPLLQETVPLLPQSLRRLYAQGLLLEGSEDDLFLKVPVVESLVQALSSKKKGETILSFRDYVSILPELPVSLMSLDVAAPQFNNVGVGIRFVPTYCSLTSASGVHFHRFVHLRELTLSHIKVLDTAVFASLPNTLVVLRLTSVVEIVLDCFTQLPSSLRSLSVTLTHHMPGIGPNIFSALPKDLAIITYNITDNQTVSDPEIDNSVLTLLPTTVNFISVPMTSGVTKEILQHIPGLTNLYLGGAIPRWLRGW